MNTISAVEARKGLGRLLNLVSLRHETFVIERAGEKLAVLTPYESDSNRGRKTLKPGQGKLDLRNMAGVGKEIWTSVDVKAYIQAERSQWN